MTESIEPMNQTERIDWLRACEQANSQETEDAWALETEFRMNVSSGEINQYGYLIRICSACQDSSNSGIDGFLVLLEDAYDYPSLLPPYEDCDHDACECEYEDAYSPLTKGTRIFEAKEWAIVAKLKTNRHYPLSYKNQLRSRRGTFPNAPAPVSTESTFQTQAKSNSTSAVPAMRWVSLIAGLIAISLFSSMYDDEDFKPTQIDQQEMKPPIKKEQAKRKPHSFSSTKRGIDNRITSYRVLNHMDAVKTDISRVSFSKKHSIIGIRQSATEISLSHIVTGKTMVVEKYKKPFFVFAWSPEDKLLTRGSSELTKNILLGTNHIFGLAQPGNPPLVLLKFFPEVESLGTINEELAKITRFSVNSDGSKIAYIRSDGTVWLGKKTAAGMFGIRQMCIDPVSKVSNIRLFSDDRIIVGWNSGALAIYTSSSDLPIRVINCNEERLTALAVSPDNNVLVTGHASGLLAFHSLTGSEQRRQIRGELLDPIVEIVFSDDSQALAVATNGGEVVTIGTSLGNSARASILKKK